MSTPLVSVILPTYNRDYLILNAIHSVLNQNFLSFELIIIDDGSTDGTIEKLSFLTDTRIKIIRNDVNIGIAKSLNKGIEHSKGSYIARIDSDDIWIDENKLKKQVDFLERNLDHFLVGTNAKYTLVNGSFRNSKLPLHNDEIRKEILYHNCFIHSSVMFRKKCEENYYSTSELFKHVEDYEFWLRIGTKNKFANLVDTTVQYFNNEKNITNQNLTEMLNKTENVSRIYKEIYPYSPVKKILFKIKYFLYKIKILRTLKRFFSYHK